LGCIIFDKPQQGIALLGGRAQQRAPAGGARIAAVVPGKGPESGPPSSVGHGLEQANHRFGEPWFGHMGKTQSLKAKIRVVRDFRSV
jgi:hypothetical protein